MSATLKRQTELQFGVRLQIAGIESVIANNDTWVERIRSVARHISLTRGSVSADDLREYCNKHKDHPDHVNAYGGIFREKGWLMIGRKKSTVPSAHAREIKIWRWAPDGPVLRKAA